MDKKIIKKELGELVVKGMDINAASFEDYEKGFLKNVDEEGKIKLKEFAEKCPDPKGAYYDWYHKACRVIRTFAPERLQEFKRFYTGDTTIKNAEDLNLITSGITHYLQGWIITNGDEHKDFFCDFRTHFKEQRYILMAVIESIDNPLFNLERDISHGIYKSEMDIAKDIQGQGHLKIAGAVAGVIIEAHLKKVVADKELPIKTHKNKSPTMDDYNNALKKDGFYSTATWRQIQVCSDIRNDCTHSNQDKPTADETDTIIRVAEQIITEVN